MNPTILGALSVLIGAVAYTIYITQTLRKGGVQPHPFSWLLWGLVTLVAYLVQRESGGAAGSWVTGFTSFVCFVIAGATLFKHRWRFTWPDWVSMGTGLLVLSFYIFARNATWSAIFATATDVVGYIPTFKKGWTEPFRDSVTSFSLNSLKFVPALFALRAYSIATYLYPATLIVVNGCVAAVLLIRRRATKSTDAFPTRDAVD